jgi:hypothetical protein
MAPVHHAIQTISSSQHQRLDAMASRQYSKYVSFFGSKRPLHRLSPIFRLTKYPNPSSRMASSTLSKLASSLMGRFAQAPEQPYSFPASGFDLIDESINVEEEEIPDYLASRFYPVYLGQVFQDRYQAVTKLGFGSSSTIWLARDLRYVVHFSDPLSEPP